MADDSAAPSGESSKAEPESQAVEVEATEDLEATDDSGDPAYDEDSAGSDVAAGESTSGPSHVRLAIIAGLVTVVGLGGMAGWLGFRAYESKALDDRRQVFLQVGRQGALNLTTLNYENIDADVQRILDSATGTFYDDFAQRAPSFTDVVRQVKSTSAGTVTAAGIESETSTEAQVLVAVTVKSEIAGQPEQPPRAWRMRISVEKIGDDTKVSNVEFVP